MSAAKKKPSRIRRLDSFVEVNIGRVRMMELMWRNAEVDARSAEYALAVQRVENQRRQADMYLEKAKLALEAAQGNCLKLMDELKKKHGIQGDDFTLNPLNYTLTTPVTHQDKSQ